MGYGQRIFGWFKRFPKGAPLAAIPLHDDLTKVYNVLEDIEGIDGLTILKPPLGNGKGWKIGLDRIGNDAAQAVSVRQPYHLELEFDAVSGETTATLYNCYHANDVISYEQAGTLTATLDAEDVLWIGIRFDTSSGATTFLQGTTFASVAEAEAPPKTQTTIDRPLYKLTSAVIDTERRFSVALDVRNAPQFNGYMIE